MKEQLEQIRIQALAALDAAETPAALEELRVNLLGKKGELTAVLKQMGKLSPEVRDAGSALALQSSAQRTPFLSANWLRSGGDHGCSPGCSPGAAEAGV